MSPKKFKSDVKVAYEQAIRNNSRSVEYVDNTLPIFDGVRVFGRDAGIDQIQTSIGLILQEAVAAASSQRGSLTLYPPRGGKSAFDGMVEILRELTGLPVSEGRGVITIAWDEDGADLS